ncbi:MAG: hypothetical protein ACP5HU_08825 [Phycisphaerae bacterium]
MELISRSELDSLLKESEYPSVSLYMPTHPAGSDSRQDPIRYRNLLRKCEEMLRRDGVGASAVREMLAKPKQLTDDAPFWRSQSGGLALFIGPGTFRYYRIPLETEEMVTVSGRFHLKPLLPLFSRNGLFYVLALSQKSIRLLQCTRYSTRKVELPDVPASMDEALAGTEFDRAQQFHTGTPPTPNSDRAAVFHTQGGGQDEAVRKKYVLEFFRMVRDGVLKAMEDRHDPLVLAGVEADRAMYRDIDRYPDTVADGVSGNVELLSDDELRKKAWEVVEPLFRKREAAAIETYQQAEHTSRGVRDIHKLAPAAYEGRIATLLVSLNEHVWGRYVPEQDRAEVHDSAQPGDEDLLDFAAAHTLTHGGEVHALSGQDMPDGAAAAAVLRF